MSMTQRPKIAGRYRLVSQLGQGGMGRVWLGRDEVLHRDVAMKEVAPPEGLAPEERAALGARTLREARAIAQLSHPNVVRLFDIVQQDPWPWIVMEYVASRSLHQVLEHDGPLPPVEAARVGLGVLFALQAAHRIGMTHRDVKPANVLLSNDGRVVLTDFGLATVEGDPTVTRPGVIIGSPAFMAPERAARGDSSPAADLWSLGATLHAAVEGQSPFARNGALSTLAALATDDPDPAPHAGPLRSVLRGLLIREPRDRMPAIEVERRLRKISGVRGKVAVPGPRVIRPAPPDRPAPMARPVEPAPAPVKPVARPVPPPPSRPLGRARVAPSTPPPPRVPPPEWPPRALPPGVAPVPQPGRRSTGEPDTVAAGGKLTDGVAAGGDAGAAVEPEPPAGTERAVPAAPDSVRAESPPPSGADSRKARSAGPDEAPGKLSESASTAEPASGAPLGSDAAAGPGEAPPSDPWSGEKLPEILVNGRERTGDDEPAVAEFPLPSLGVPPGAGQQDPLLPAASSLPGTATGTEAEPAAGTGTATGSDAGTEAETPKAGSLDLSAGHGATGIPGAADRAGAGPGDLSAPAASGEGAASLEGGAPDADAKPASADAKPASADAKPASGARPTEEARPAGNAGELPGPPPPAEPETADLATPEPETADLKTPEPETADLTAPKPATADLATPDVATPESAAPESAAPESAAPGAATHEAATPKPATLDEATPGPETPDPETPDLETRKPESPEPGQPEPATADLATPEPTTTDLAPPDQAATKPAASDLATPDLATPEPETADLATPQPATPTSPTPKPPTPKPSTAKPPAFEPAAAKPAAAKPWASKPWASKSSASKSSASKSSASKPSPTPDAASPEDLEPPASKEGASRAFATRAFAAGAATTRALNAKVGPIKTVFTPGRSAGTDPGEAPTKPMAGITGALRNVASARVAPYLPSAVNRRPVPRRVLVVAGAVLLAVLVVVLLVVFLPGHGTQRAAAPPAASHAVRGQSPSATAPSPAPTTDATGTQPASAAPPPRSGTGASFVLPAGWNWYHDSTGFTIAIPDGWTTTKRKTIRYFTDPHGGRTFNVDQSDQPKPDPVADWTEQKNARVGNGDFPGYQQIKIARVAYFTNAADWEFTYLSGGTRVHVINRGVITSKHQAYGMWWQTPDSQWQANLGLFKSITASFQPRPE
jgi:hypothetical protein